MRGNVVLKLDMEKSYEMLSWYFLKDVLKRIDFNDVWMDHIWRSIFNVWYSLIINDTRQWFFSFSQGLKQGDPISHALFVIVVEVLSRSLNNLLKNPNFIPFSMNKSGPQITNLTYVDDIVIFSSNKNKSIKLIMRNIRKYEVVSGQMVNVSKSCFLTSPNPCAHWIYTRRRW